MEIKSLIRCLRVEALLILLVVVASSCSFLPGSGFPGGGKRDGAPSTRLSECKIQNAIPRAEAKSSRGNPDTYTVRGKTYRVIGSSEGFRERGDASWYGTAFHGNPTSSGEPYDMYAMTAAHKHLPLPTYVEVKNLDNGRKVIVRVNDRGPFISGRIIDLSYAAATKLGMLQKGTARVEVLAIDPKKFDMNQWQGDERCVAQQTTTSTSYPVVAQSTSVIRSTPSVTSDEEAGEPVIPSAEDVSRQNKYDQSTGGSGAGKSLDHAESLQATFLQLATYSQVDVANRELIYIERELNKRSIPYSAGLFPYFPEGKSTAWYRLRLGPIESRARADQLAQNPVFKRYGRVFPVEQ